MDAAGQASSQDEADRPEWPGEGPAGEGPAGNGQAAKIAVAAPASATPPPRRLALFGLPPDVAEPMTMLAEILGWQVVSFPSGPAVCPPARLCLAMLPESPDCSEERGQIIAWSTDFNLNEHIYRTGLSIMDQPLCITRVEQMLETLVCEP